MTIPSKVEIRDGLARLSGLSPAVQAILPRLSDDEFDAGELSRMVGQDPVLAARVLRLANSPFYGLPRQVGSLREAVMILGFSNLCGLVLSSGLIGAFSDAEATACSLATAAAAGSLARSLNLDVGQAFSAGLLHNLGALLLGHFAPNHWQALAGESSDGVGIRLAKERQIFGYDHCELGAEIAGQWRFPATIQTAILRYPQPPDDPAETLADLVHAAWVIAGANQTADCPALAPDIAGRLGLESAEGQAALAEATEAARRSHGALDGL
ncbi:MAG: HDOD domain-containing protein [Gallionellaceae bacterium]|nr:HDOD domain-containing protein [Gallionellaceae bacterium]